MSLKVFKVKDFVEHQGIGGKQIIIDEKVTEILTNEEVLARCAEGNWACKNFVDRRGDFTIGFPLKLYYGHVDGLGYVVAEDELEVL